MQGLLFLSSICPFASNALTWLHLKAPFLQTPKTRSDPPDIWQCFPKSRNSIETSDKKMIIIITLSTCLWIFREMFSLGSSKPWPDVMEVLTGQRKMDAGPLLEYFKPLQDWLEQENKGHDISWDEECPLETFQSKVAFVVPSVAVLLLSLVISSLRWMMS